MKKLWHYFLDITFLKKNVIPFIFQMGNWAELSEQAL